MKNLLKKFLGILMLLGAILGLVISLAGLVTIWKSVPSVMTSIQDGVQNAKNTLTLTGDLLSLINDSLEKSKSDILFIEKTTQDISTTIQTTSDTTSLLADMVDSQFISITQNTQTALSTMQKSAELIDNTLEILSFVPILGSRYAPETPLAASVGQVNQSLEPIPTSLRKVAENLNDTTSSLQSINEDIQQLSENIGKLENGIQETQSIISEYQSIISKLQSQVDLFSNNLAAKIRIFAWILTGFFIWLFLSQIGLIVQGIDHLF